MSIVSHLQGVIALFQSDTEVVSIGIVGGTAHGI